MFIDRWIPARFLSKSEICGVEAIFNEDGIHFYYTLLRNKGKKLELTGSGEIKTIEEFPAKILKDKIPLILVVNGKGVISKKVLPGENLQSREEIVQQNLPAAKENDFHIQLYRQTGSAFITLCRKEEMDKLMNQLRNKGYELAGCLLGAPAVLGLRPLLGGFNSINCSTHRIDLNESEIEAIVPAADNDASTVTIDNISFHRQHTLGFAGALSYLLRLRISESGNNAINELYENHSAKNKLRFLTMLVVAVAFIISMVSVFFYTSYFDRNNQIETELSVYQGKYDQINSLLSEYQKKKDLIENAGVLNKSRTGEFADRIAATLPDEVILSDMIFNPVLEQEDGNDSLLIFGNGQLIIKGHCNKSLIINEWINVLKMQDFVKKVSLEKFIYNSTGQGPNYEIKLVTE